MKKFIFTAVFLGLASLLNAQSRQEDTSSVYLPIIPEDKQERLKNVDLIMNMNFNLRADHTNREYHGSLFRFEQFRLEKTLVFEVFG